MSDKVTNHTHEVFMSWNWIKEFHLFLFDFDGLLVDTESLHFAAYQKLCQQYGHTLDWSFKKYCAFAHLSSEALRHQIYIDLPQLKTIGWDTLYKEKKKHYISILTNTKVSFMPGAKDLLTKLKEYKIKHCVVTHSPRKDIELIRQQQPDLNTIPYWFTREDYNNPKPSPDGYIKAIQTLSKEDTVSIGFEDSIRGLQALQNTSALPILVVDKSHPLIDKADSSKPFMHFNSLEEMKNLESIKHLN
jgi:beta-phosphoglucomutase